MSTDFTGKNLSWNENELYQMISNAVAKKLALFGFNLTREKLYDIYKSLGFCSRITDENWEYFDKYTERYEMNDYTGNEFDNIVVLSASLNDGSLFDRDVNSADSRRATISSRCESAKEHGLCNDFSLTGMFPHVDIPNSIVSIVRSLRQFYTLH